MKHRAPALIAILLLFCLRTFAQTNVDSLVSVAGNSALADSSRVTAMIELSLHYKDSDLPTSLVYGQQALDLSNKNTSLFLIAKSQDNLATILKFKGEYKEAERLYLESARTFTTLQDSLHLSLVYSHLGSYYQGVEQNQLAIMYMLRSLAMDQKLGGREKSIAATLNNIGNVYYTDKNYDLAMVYYKQALAMNVQLKFRRYEAINYLNIGNTFKDMKKIDSASWYYKKSILLSEEINVTWVSAAAHEGLGSCLLKSDQPEQAQVEFEKGLEAAVSFGNKELEYYLRAGLAEALKDQGQIEEAKSLWQFCMDTATTYKFTLLKSQLYLSGAEIYEAAGDLQFANKLYKRYAELKDSMVIEQNAVIYRSFEERLKEEEILHSQELARKSQEEISRAENRRNKMALLFTAVVLLLSIGLGLFAFRSYRLKKKSHEDLSVQKDIIEEKNKEILSSIGYAQRLQEAILPSQETWQQAFPDSFIFYRPKDIVAGDFYWMERKNTVLMFAVADCTGHGVPGALVSVVCSNALNRAVREFGLTSPGEILDKAAGLVIETFENGERDVQDGMDISLCCYNEEKNELQWSGANLPLWVVKQQPDGPVLSEIKPDKQPIGKFDLRKPFHTHTCSISKGDSIYLFSDGYADQFGGPKGKKFKYKPLQELLLSQSLRTSREQSHSLEVTLQAWQGNLEQVDDICVIGIRL